jgi:hypothetical protein
VTLWITLIPAPTGDPTKEMDISNLQTSTPKKKKKTNSTKKTLQKRKRNSKKEKEKPQNLQVGYKGYKVLSPHGPAAGKKHN